jgi:hypothetical protein
MPLSVSALVLHGGLLANSHPVRIGVSHVSMGGVFSVQDSEDLVRGSVKAVAHEQRTREEERQEHPTRPPVQNRPDDFCPSHLDRFIAFHSAVFIPPRGIYRQYTPTTDCCQALMRCFRPRRLQDQGTRAPCRSLPPAGSPLRKNPAGAVYGGPSYPSEIAPPTRGTPRGHADGVRRYML